MSSFVKPEVAALQAIRLLEPPHDHKLSQNENPFGYPDHLKDEVVRRMCSAGS